MTYRKTFTFDGTVSTTYGLYITGQQTYNSAERDYSFYEIPGRSGDLLAPFGRWKNQQIVYPAFIAGSDFETDYKALRAFLTSHVGYYRLEDDYNPGEYRIAAFAGTIEPTISQYFKSGTFNITFNAKPQRWLTIGETATEFTADGTITNPTLFDAAPIIRAYGDGTIGIGTDEITIAANTYPYIDIDCDLGNAFYDTVNCNSLVSVTGTDFPKLHPGANGITIDGNLTSIEIIPRWFTL